MSSRIGPLSVPLDVITAQANALIADVASGSDGSSVIASLDAATKAAVCQRAMDLLTLLPCSQAPSPDFSLQKGNCLDDSSNPAAYASPYKTLIPGVVAACQAQGIMVREEVPLVVAEPAIGLLLGAIGGGFLGHHYDHTVVGVIAGALLGSVVGSVVYNVQEKRVPVQPATSGYGQFRG